MPDPGRQYFDPADSIPAIIRNGARLLVVTDPADEKVNVEHQIAFVRKFRKAGGQVEQFFAQATDKDHHFVSAYARYVAAACIAGKSNQEIAQGLAELVKKRLAEGTNARLQSELRLQSEDVWALPLDDLSNLTDVAAADRCARGSRSCRAKADRPARIWPRGQTLGVHHRHRKHHNRHGLVQQRQGDRRPVEQRQDSSAPGS